MATQLAPHRTDLPPPRTPRTTGTYDRDHSVGWVTERTIGFRDFANEADAMAAAWMAHRTLARALARRRGTRPIPIDVEPLTLARDGDRERILASGRPIARLVRPGTASPSGPESFGFEIDVPAPRDAAGMRAAAFLLYRTLRRSGIRWTMPPAGERGDPALDAPPRLQDATHTAHGPAAPPVDRDAARRRRRRLVGVSAALGIGALAVVLRSLLTVALVVTVLGTGAALVALAALIVLVRLVATDVMSGVRRAHGRRATRRAPSPTIGRATLARATTAGGRR